MSWRIQSRVFLNLDLFNRKAEEIEEIEAGRGRTAIFDQTSNFWKSKIYKTFGPKAHEHSPHGILVHM